MKNVKESTIKNIDKNNPILVESHKCDLCGLCVGVCPPDCINISDHHLEIIGSECIQCGICLAACGIGALTWNSETDCEDPYEIRTVDDR